MRRYSKMFFVMIFGSLMSQSLMAENLCPLDYPFNPTSEKNPFHLSLSEKARKSFNLSKGAIRSLVKNSPKYATMDERIRSKISRNSKNFYQLDWDYVSLYWDKDKGVSIVGTVNSPSAIYVNRTRFNGPEDMAHELARTEPINMRTNRPYFELTPELLIKLEEQTNTKLTQEQKDLLRDYASVLNENFHYFFGEPFFVFQDVINELDKSELIGRFFPNKLYMKKGQEYFVPSVEQERNFLYLKLIGTLSASKQKEVIQQLFRLPEDKTIRENLLNDTERLLTEFGMKKYEKTVVKIVKELKKENLNEKKETALLKKLLPIIDKSRFKYDLYSRYLQPREDTLEQIMLLVDDKNQKVAEQIQYDIERVAEIHKNKMKIGSVLGRPLYNYDKVMRQFSVASSNCQGRGESKILLADGNYDTVYYSNATQANLVIIFNSRYAQLGKVGVSFSQLVQDIQTYAKEQKVDLSDINNNSTAFGQAMYLLSKQASTACVQVLQDEYTKEVIKFTGLRLDDKRSMAEKIKLKPFNSQMLVDKKVRKQRENKELER